MGIPWFCFAGRYLLCKTYEVDNAGFDQHFDRAGSCANAGSVMAEGGSRGVTQAASASLTDHVRSKRGILMNLINSP
jgi:hypothetical protein